MTARDTIKVTHNGVEIQYSERDNKFHFELRGRGRIADSLRAAKEAIDAPVKVKKPPFERFFAWLKGSEWDKQMWRKVEVTSIAEPNSWGNYTEVWIIDGGARSKQRGDYVYPLDEKNDAKVAAWEELEKERRIIIDKQRKLQESMRPYAVPKDE